MTEKPEVPEKIYADERCISDIEENTYSTVRFQPRGAFNIEYIPKDTHDKRVEDAIKHIKEVWDTHHQAIEDHKNYKNTKIYKPMFDLIFQDLWQAIKATVSLCEKTIEARDDE